MADGTIYCNVSDVMIWIEWYVVSYPYPDSLSWDEDSLVMGIVGNGHLWYLHTYIILIPPKFGFANYNIVWRTLSNFWWLILCFRCLTLVCHDILLLQLAVCFLVRFFMHTLDLHCALWMKWFHPLQVPVLFMLSLLVRYEILCLRILMFIVIKFCAVLLHCCQCWFVDIKYKSLEEAVTDPIL